MEMQRFFGEVHLKTTGLYQVPNWSYGQKTIKGGKRKRKGWKGGKVVKGGGGDEELDSRPSDQRCVLMRSIIYQNCDYLTPPYFCDVGNFCDCRVKEVLPIAEKLVIYAWLPIETNENLAN